MATSSLTLTYVGTYDDSYPSEATARYFGDYAGHYVTVYKAKPTYTGIITQVSITLNLNIGTRFGVGSRNSTWRVGLDSLGPNYNSSLGKCTGSRYVQVGANYNTTTNYSKTFSANITSTTTDHTVTFSEVPLDGNGEFYIYLCSAASSSKSIIYTSGISGVTTYGNATNTNLYIGLSNNPSGSSAEPTPQNRTVYWRVTGLSSPIKNYTGFYLYKNSGFSMIQGQDSAPTGTLIDSYSSSTSTAQDFSKSFSIPISDSSKTPKIGTTTEVVAVARNASGYYRIGGSGAQDAPAYPKVCSIKMNGEDWYKNVINTSVTVTGKNTATITVTNNTKNSPRHLSYVELTTAAMSSSGTNTFAGTMSGYCTFDTSTASSQTKTISKTGLSPGTTYSYQVVAYGVTDYSNYKYYGLDRTISFTTDANYTATNSATVTSSTTATISCSISSKINLDGYIYYSTTANLTSKPSTKVAYGDYYTISKNLTGLTANKQYTYYFYVYSSTSGNLYSVGSTTFTTDASSYTGTITSTVNGATSVKINLTSSISTTNLNGKIYLSTSSSISSTSGLSNFNISTGYTNLTLTANTAYTYYAYVYSSASGKFYSVGSTTFRIDASSYSATTTASEITSSSAKLTLGTISPNTTNLDSNWYLSTSDSSSNIFETITRGSSAILDGLSHQTAYTYHVFVKSTVSGIYYKVGTASFTTLVASSPYKSEILIGVATGTAATSTTMPVRIKNVLPSTAGLNGTVYISASNVQSSTSALSWDATYSGINSLGIITGLSANTTYSKSFYVYNNGTYYNIGTIGFTTPVASYTGTLVKNSQSGSITSFNLNNLSNTNQIVGWGLISKRYQNLFPDGNFDTYGNDTAHVVYGAKSLKVNGNSGQSETTVGLGTVPMIQNHIYYARYLHYQTTVCGTFGIYWPIAEPNFVEGQPAGAAGQWNKCSGRNVRSNWASGNQAMRIDFNNNGTAGTAWIDNMLFIDLTAEFGSGKEPSLAWCDENIQYGKDYCYSFAQSTGVGSPLLVENLPKNTELEVFLVHKYGGFIPLGIKYTDTDTRILRNIKTKDSSNTYEEIYLGVNGTPIKQNIYLN